jgi:Fur family ferric uptake transcriptional regulator
MDELDAQARRLRDFGLKVTEPRMRVLRLLRDSGQRHWTADDLHRALVAEHSDIGLATVYRVLTQLEQAGILQRSRFDTERAVYELASAEHHDHLVCVSCGRVEEFHDPDIERRQREIAAERGFELVEHTLALYGQCSKPGCRGRR